jgi:hypothetical protein
MNKTKKYIIISIALIITTVAFFALPQLIIFYLHQGTYYIGSPELENANNLYNFSNNFFPQVAILFAISSVIAIIITLIYWKIK